MRPGKPLTFATSNLLISVYWVATFWRFVKLAIAKISGLRLRWEAQFIQVGCIRAGGAIGWRIKIAKSTRNLYLGKLQLNNGIYKFHPAFGQHSSGNLINLAQTNALTVLPLKQSILKRLTGEIT